jgi:hypothetical protein
MAEVPYQIGQAPDLQGFFIAAWIDLRSALRAPP